MTIAIQVSLDCADPHSQARFWADALGYEVVFDEAAIREIMAQGWATDEDVTSFEGKLVWKTGAACSDLAGARPRMYFQQVPEPRLVKNRVHLDLHLQGEDRATEVARLVALGATVLYEGAQGPQTWVTMADPEGNEFCVS